VDIQDRVVTSGGRRGDNVPTILCQGQKDKIKGYVPKGWSVIQVPIHIGKSSNPPNDMSGNGNMAYHQYPHGIDTAQVFVVVMQMSSEYRCRNILLGL
jgi:hypothetical protein